jgi:hypothetical protein
MSFLDKVGKFIHFDGKTFEFNLTNKNPKKVKILIRSELVDDIKKLENLDEKKFFMYFNSKWNVVLYKEIKIFENVYSFNGMYELDVFYTEFREIGTEEMREFKIKSILDL